MKAAIEYVADLPVVTVSGRLDTATAPVFDTQIANLLAEPRRRILLDLSEVTFISSAGLRSILYLIKHTAARKGRIGLFAAPPHILEVIEISGFPSLVDLYPDRESALNG